MSFVTGLRSVTPNRRLERLWTKGYFKPQLVRVIHIEEATYVRASTRTDALAQVHARRR